MPAGEAWDALDELVDLSLLQDSAAGRYRFHDLVRFFARARLQEESLTEREALTGRVTSWLLRMATMAGRWFEPGLGRPARPDPDLAVMSSTEDAELWLRVNVDNWLGALRSAVASGQYSLVLDCAESMHWFCDRWAHASHWHEVFSLGTELPPLLAWRSSGPAEPPGLGALQCRSATHRTRCVMRHRGLGALDGRTAITTL
jgi:hypothetical protein